MAPASSRLHALIETAVAADDEDRQGTLPAAQIAIDSKRAQDIDKQQALGDCLRLVEQLRGVPDRVDGKAGTAQRDHQRLGRWPVRCEQDAHWPNSLKLRV